MELIFIIFNSISVIHSNDSGNVTEMDSVKIIHFHLYYSYSLLFQYSPPFSFLPWSFVGSIAMWPILCVICCFFVLFHAIDLIELSSEHTVELADTVLPSIHRRPKRISKWMDGGVSVQSQQFILCYRFAFVAWQLCVFVCVWTDNWIERWASFHLFQ